MLPPLPRCSRWAHSSLEIYPIRVSLPRFHFRVGLHIDLFEDCSAFTRVAACTLARSPIRDRYPKASAISSPPCLLRLLPAGAVAGRGLHPLENAALSRRTPIPGSFVAPRSNAWFDAELTFNHRASGRSSRAEADIRIWPWSRGYEPAFPGRTGW